MTKWNFKVLGFLVVLLAASRLVPAHPLDPWGLFNIRKIFQVVFAITAIQAIGQSLINRLGVRAGVVITGLLGGLISSTAVTVTIAKKTRDHPDDGTALEALLYYSATLAMLIEAMLMVWVGESELHSSLFIVFSGPLLLTGVKILLRLKSSRALVEPDPKKTAVEIKAILKLALFILAIMAVSKLGQRVFGQFGLLVLTFLVSLFEIHGSIVANVQLHEAKALDLFQLGGLLAVSILASYISKFFLVTTVGSPAIAKEVRRWTLQIIVALSVSWALFAWYVWSVAKL